MIQDAEIYQAGDMCYVLPSSKAVTGLWVATAPLLRVRADDSPPVKGEAALRALAESRHGVPLPNDENNVIRDLLNDANARSWGAFAKSCKYVSLSLEGDWLTVMPFKRLKRGAFAGMPALAITLPGDSPAERIGRAIDDALAQCD